MKNVIGLDGKSYKFNLHGYSKKSNNKSAPHLAARELLARLFPQTSILEEVLLPGTRLRVDFYIPSHSIMVEVNGAQHSKYIPHFHGASNKLGKLNFYKGVNRDRRKADWCELNQITLIVLEHDDKEHWEQLLKHR